MTSYVIRGGAAGKVRLRVIAEALWPTTLMLLNRVGLKPGFACLDVGCGGGDVALALARLVGPTGWVMGRDVDETKLQLARQEAEHAALTNVTFCAGAVEQLDAAATYDLVYARFLLTHLREPGAALQRMVEATKPGGVIVVEDLYHADIFCYPACPALDHYVSLYNQTVRLRGADPEIGPKLPSLFRAAGLADVQLAHCQPAFLSGEAKRIHQLTLTNIKAAIVADALASEAQLALLETELEDFTQRTDTIISFPRVFQVWAQRP